MCLLIYAVASSSLQLEFDMEQMTQIINIL